MRRFYAVLLLLITSFFAMTSASMAQSAIRTCPSVDLTGPSDGAVLDPGYRVNFTWNSEPRGTAKREWISVRIDSSDDAVAFDDATKASADRGLYKGFARGRPGVYAWAVIFYDAKGNPICQSEARTYVIAGAGFASLSGESAAAVKAALGRYVVKLAGSSYAGAFNREVAGNNYDDLADATGAFDWKAQGYSGLDVHGNNNANVLRGSNQGDNIWGYGGNDLIDGRGGNDKLYGGDESCNGALCNFFNTKGDVILGGDGDDEIHGGDEGCTGALCNLFGTTGDAISGGNGNDIINGDGGNDVISGDDGSDIVNGNAGNDVLTGNLPLNINDGDLDVVTGGPGADVIASTGDTINP